MRELRYLNASAHSTEPKLYSQHFHKIGPGNQFKTSAQEVISAGFLKMRMAHFYPTKEKAVWLKYAPLSGFVSPSLQVTIGPLPASLIFLLICSSTISGERTQAVEVCRHRVAVDGTVDLDALWTSF
jgi:hypothetical protein